jgi:hypothetical protein
MSGATPYSSNREETKNLLNSSSKPKLEDEAGLGDLPGEEETQEDQVVDVTPKQSVLPSSASLDPDKMKEEDETWQKCLFEIYLSRNENIHKYKYREGFGEVVFADYKKLSEQDQAEIRTAFLASQSQANVDKMMQFEDDNRGSIDCLKSNKVQGYWNMRGFYDCCWNATIMGRDRVWLKKEGIIQAWLPKAIVLGYTLCGVGILKHWYPQPVYAIEGLCMLGLFYYYVKWLAHITCGNGLWTFWSDTTVERTFPGAVRYFSIDYLSMVCAVWMWLFIDNTGGLKVLWVLASSTAMQLVYGLHCTFSSTERSIALGVAYSVASISWVLLWMPSQSKWLSGAELGASYKGRGTLGTINPNIAFMQTSIMAIGMPLLIEFAAFMFMELGWWVFLTMIPTVYFTIRHIGFAALVFMAIAKLTAHGGRSAYDPYGICIGSGWTV